MQGARRSSVRRGISAQQGSHQCREDWHRNVVQPEWRHGLEEAGDRRRHSSPAPEEWEQMRVKITALGKEVAATRSPEVIREYKNQIRKLLEAVIAASLREKEIRFTRRVRGGMPRQEVLRTVEVIDEKLNLLTVDLMDEQARPIRILSRINEIEGLIVDLLS